VTEELDHDIRDFLRKFYEWDVPIRHRREIDLHQFLREYTETSNRMRRHRLGSTVRDLDKAARLTKMSPRYEAKYGGLCYESRMNRPFVTSTGLQTVPSRHSVNWFEIRNQPVKFLLLDDMVLYTEEAVIEVHRNERGQLSRADGPALVLRGVGETNMYYYNGMAIRKDWTEGPMTVNKLLKARNSEIRRAGVELGGGWAKIIENSREGRTKNFVIVHKDRIRGEELVVVNNLDDSAFCLLMVKCGTGRDFAIPVPQVFEDGRLINTCREAQAWLTGMDPDEFEYPTRRT
jgi:hypothetical protein